MEIFAGRGILEEEVAAAGRISSMIFGVPVADCAMGISNLSNRERSTPYFAKSFSIGARAELLISETMTIARFLSILKAVASAPAK